MQDDGTWTPPVNIGVPLNTVDDDVFFVTTADGRRGYFSSDKISGYGEKDIYFVDLPEEMEAEGLTVLKGFIIPPPGEELPPSTILYVTDKATGEVKSYKPRQRDGVYVAILPPCKEYNLDYRVNDKTVHTEDIFVECESAYQEINKEIYLNPVSITGPASIVDLPKGSPPGKQGEGRTGQVGRQKAKPEEYLTDAQLKEKGKTHTMPDASYAAEYVKYYEYNKPRTSTRRDGLEGLHGHGGGPDRQERKGHHRDRGQCLQGAHQDLRHQREPEPPADGRRPQTPHRGRAGPRQERGCDLSWRPSTPWCRVRPTKATTSTPRSTASSSTSS
jgi:hypothetical protein